MIAVNRGAAALALAVLAGCSPREKSGPPPKNAPAKVTPAAESGGAPTLELSAAAVERLGLTLAVVEERTVQRMREFSGELVVPPGARAELRAPFAATVRAGRTPFSVGGHVESGEVMFLLEPLLSPESERQAALQRVQLAQAANQLEIARAENEGAIGRARARLAAARTAFERAVALVDAEAGSRRARDEAQAELEAAQAEFSSGEHQRQVLADLAQTGELTTPASLSLCAPFAGELIELLAAQDQVVPAGAKLGTLERHDVLWVRVPIYVGIAAELSPACSARLVGMDGRGSSAALTARAIAGLPSADAASETVDLWFELTPPAHALRPGQRVSVELPTTEAVARLIVPWSALVFDVHGGASVYVHVGELRYRRAAVELVRASEDEAILARGPEPGTEVVSAGVAELFGTEFGTGR